MNTPNTLIEATVTNNIMNVTSLLHAGRNPHEVLDDEGITALHHAAQNDFVEIAEFY